MVGPGKSGESQGAAARLTSAVGGYTAVYGCHFVQEHVIVSSVFINDAYPNIKVLDISHDDDGSRADSVQWIYEPPDVRHCPSTA